MDTKNRKKRIFSILIAGTLISCPILAEKPAAASDSFRKQKTEERENIDYRALVWIDKGSVERYGGEEVFRGNLEKMFRDTTYFFNESPNKFDYHFTFVPAGIHGYDMEGDRSRIEEFRKQAFGKLDTDKYDYVLFLALDSDKNVTSCGGGGASGQCVVMYCRTLEAQKKGSGLFDKVPPVQGPYSDLGHEYGHMRGATDLYQYKISAADNPVSHEELKPPACNMGTGFKVWSDYCSALFNYTAKQKQLDSRLGRKIFPRKWTIRVFADGKPASDVSVRFYGTRAGGAHNHRDVYPKPYRTFQTNDEGHVEVTDLYGFFHPAGDDPNIPSKSPVDMFPYFYWFNFLVEASYGDRKEYVWVPDFVLQEKYLTTGEDTFETVLNFSKG